MNRIRQTEIPYWHLNGLLTLPCGDARHGKDSRLDGLTWSSLLGEHRV